MSQIVECPQCKNHVVIIDAEIEANNGTFCPNCFRQWDIKDSKLVKKRKHIKWNFYGFELNNPVDKKKRVEEWQKYLKGNTIITKPQEQREY